MTPRNFLQHETAPGLALLLAGLAGLALANSPLAPLYHQSLAIAFMGNSAAGWINDALMPVFYLAVGLEIRRELAPGGALASRRQAGLPVVAALGGMAAPAAVYLLCAGSDPVWRAGWAVPTATDIAFALGVLSLLVRRLPPGLRVFLLTLAIVDDIGSILIIGLFFAGQLEPVQLAVAGGLILLMLVLRRCRVAAIWPYLLLGLPLWYAVHHSGVHATVAGILLAFVLPYAAGQAVLARLHAPVAFLILPVFAFANAGVTLANNKAGVTLAGAGTDIWQHPVFLGIALGLLFGKPLGIAGASWLAVRCRFGSLPAATGWRHIAGAGMLGGVGFTMAMFVANLAFAGTPLLDTARLAIMAGSLLAAVAGYAMLRLSNGKAQHAA